MNAIDRQMQSEGAAAKGLLAGAASGRAGHRGTDGMAAFDALFQAADAQPALTPETVFAKLPEGQGSGMMAANVAALPDGMHPTQADTPAESSLGLILARTEGEGSPATPPAAGEGPLVSNGAETPLRDGPDAPIRTALDPTPKVTAALTDVAAEEEKADPIPAETGQAAPAEQGNPTRKPAKDQPVEARERLKAEPQILTTAEGMAPVPAALPQETPKVVSGTAVTAGTASPGLANSPNPRNETAAIATAGGPSATLRSAQSSSGKASGPSTPAALAAPPAPSVPQGEPQANPTEAAQGQATEPTPAPAPSAPSTETWRQMAEPGWAEALGERIAMELTADGSRIEISLNPETLGHLEITMQIVDGAAQISMTTQTDEAARLLNQQEAKLSEALARSGISLAGHSATADRDAGQARRDGRAPAGAATGEPADTPARPATGRASGLINILA